MCECTNKEKYKNTLMENAELCVCKKHARWCCLFELSGWPSNITNFIKHEEKFRK